MKIKMKKSNANKISEEDMENSTEDICMNDFGKVNVVQNFCADFANRESIEEAFRFVQKNGGKINPEKECVQTQYCDGDISDEDEDEETTTTSESTTTTTTTTTTTVSTTSGSTTTAQATTRAKSSYCSVCKFVFNNIRHNLNNETDFLEDELEDNIERICEHDYTNNTSVQEFCEEIANREVIQEVYDYIINDGGGTIDAQKDCENMEYCSKTEHIP